MLRVQFMLLTAKLILLLFWLTLLLVVQTPLAKPFAQLLGGVAVLLLLLHGVTLLFCISALKGRQSVWWDRLQLLLFGAFHLYGFAAAPAAVQRLSARASEGRPGSGQAD